MRVSVWEEERAEMDGEDVEQVFPFRLGPPNQGRHHDPAPAWHGWARRQTNVARHRRRRPGNHGR